MHFAPPSLAAGHVKAAIVLKIDAESVDNIVVVLELIGAARLPENVAVTVGDELGQYLETLQLKVGFEPSTYGRPFRGGLDMI